MNKQSQLQVADPASFLGSNSVLGTLIFFEKTVYSLINVNISEFVLLPHQFFKYYNFELNLFSKAAQCPFKVHCRILNQLAL